MIRVQMGCLACGQMIDGTFAARSIVGIVAAFNDVHLYPKCQEEPLDGGEKEGEPAAGTPVEGDGGAEQAGSGEEPDRTLH